MFYKNIESKSEFIKALDWQRQELLKDCLDDARPEISIKELQKIARLLHRVLQGVSELEIHSELTRGQFSEYFVYNATKGLAYLSSTDYVFEFKWKEVEDEHGNIEEVYRGLRLRRMKRSPYHDERRRIRSVKVYD